MSDPGSRRTQRRMRNARNRMHAVPDSIADAAIDAAYLEFCRKLGHWNPEFPGQRDALKAALRHSWETSADFIEAAVLRALIDRLTLLAQAHSAAAQRHPVGDERRALACALNATESIIELVTEMADDRDAFNLIKIDGADDA